MLADLRRLRLGYGCGGKLEKVHIDIMVTTIFYWFWKVRTNNVGLLIGASDQKMGCMSLEHLLADLDSSHSMIYDHRALLDGEDS